MKISKFCLASASLLSLVPGARGAGILSPSDFIIAVNANSSAPVSGYPAAENPGNAIDGTNAKYLNSGGFGTGFIVTPGAAAAVQSFRITTANDAEGRDPASYQIFGTNSAISSTDNSTGTGEAWSLLTSGTLSLPSARNTLGSFVNFSNAVSFTSYKVVFPSLKSDSLMQLAEFQAFTGADGGGSAVFSAGQSILAIDTVVSASRHPLAENPANLLDGAANTKYLNFGKEGSGVIITPAAGASVVGSFVITTANDRPARDPNSYELYGTNQAITEIDNSYGTAQAWSLISSGQLSALQVPDGRGVDGEAVSFANAASYTSYRLVFPTLKDAPNDNSMQIAGLQFFAAVPEPGTASLAALAVLGCFRRRR